MDKSMQSFKKINLVVMKLNHFFALHFFANGLYHILIYIANISDYGVRIN